MKYNNPLSSIPQPIQGYIDYLLLNVYSLSSSGLYEGKIGFAVVLFELSKLYQNEYLEEQAYEVLKEALVSKQEDCSLEHGLAGIGYGFLYLTHNKFIEADFEELFGEQHQQVIKNIETLLEQSTDIRELSSQLYYLYAYQLYSNRNDIKNLALNVKEKVVRILIDIYSQSVEQGIYAKQATALTVYQTEYFLKICYWSNQKVNGDFIEALLKFIKCRGVSLLPLMTVYLSILAENKHKISPLIEANHRPSVVSSLKLNFLSPNEYIDLLYLLNHSRIQKTECNLVHKLKEEFLQSLDRIDTDQYRLLSKHNISFASGLPRYLLHYVYQESRVVNSLINPFV